MTKVPYLTPVPDRVPDADPAPPLPGLEPPGLAERRAEEVLVVDVSGFEGPLDLLLNLSRVQKVDLLQISVLDLADHGPTEAELSRARAVLNASLWMADEGPASRASQRLAAPGMAFCSWRARGIPKSQAATPTGPEA